MHAQVIREFRMESRKQQPTVPNEYGLTVELAEHLDLATKLSDPRRTDEHPSQRPIVAGELDVGLEALHLATVGVAIDLEVCDAKMLPVEHDHPGARPENRPPILTDRVIQAVKPGQVHDRRRLTARDHEPVQPVEILGQPHFDHLRAESAQDVGVLAEGALQRKNADSHPPNSRRNAPLPGE
ncbi:MAG: hypothetical protein HW413_1074 [Thermoleophilia bacterium]|nr:hypothetical protein [Thermoleophilia bacterium]